MNKAKQKILDEFDDTFNYLEGAHRDHDGSTDKEEVQAFLSNALDEYIMSLLPEEIKNQECEACFQRMHNCVNGWNNCLDQIKKNME